MKKLGIKSLTKQIICIIIVLMLCNFIIPNYSYAVSTEDGGSLLETMAKFLCYVPDKVMEFLQEMFVNPNKIQLKDGSYSIKYSPGIIFSGEVPAFDINFISPKESKSVAKVEEQYVSLIDALEFNNAEKLYSKKYKPNINPFVTKNSCIKEIKNNASYEYDVNREINIEELEGKIQSIESDDEAFQGEIWSSEENTMVCAWESKSKTEIYIIVNSYRLEHTPVQDGGTMPDKIGEIFLYKIPSKGDLEGATDITDTNATIETVTEYKSITGIIQPTISTWYKGLRRIALVALLSVLIYIGIKIALSSTSAKDKSKYKKMLKDWFLALCILFTLHYIMSITVTIVTKINEVIKASSIAANGEDILITSIRNKIANGEQWADVLTYVVIYFVLAIYTVIYTIQYLKRLIHLAFLTMITPLITFTYPLDKIKDSKAQAFDMWLKDYMFFSLIQVVHLLIYYVFVGSAINLTQEGNWLYAIVAIGFIMPAEKLIKKMFGFEKSKSLGALTAGVTGALVTNALNKVKGGSNKQASGGSGASSNSEGAKTVRTYSANDALQSLRTSDALLSGDGFEASGNGTTNQGTNGNSGNSTSGGSLKGSKKTQNSSRQERRLARKARRGNVIGGVKSLVGRYHRKAGQAVLSGGLSLTGAMLGFAAGVSQGDFKAAGAGALLGVQAGKSMGQRLSNSIDVSKISKTMDEVEDTWNEGAHGKEYAQRKKFERELRRSSDYDKLRDNHSNFSDENLEKILKEGIKDTETIGKILKYNEKNPSKNTIKDAIKYSKMAKKCPENILYDNKKFIRFCQDKNLNLTEEELNNLRKILINFK